MAHNPWQGNFNRPDKVSELLRSLRGTSRRKFRPWIGADGFSFINLLMILTLIAAIYLSPPYIGDGVRVIYPVVKNTFRCKLSPESFVFREPKIIGSANPGQSFADIEDDDTREALLRFCSQHTPSRDEKLILLRSDALSCSAQSKKLELTFTGNAKPLTGLAILYTWPTEHGQNAYREVSLERDASRYLNGGVSFWEPNAGEQFIMAVKVGVRDLQSVESNPFPALNTNQYGPKFKW